MTKNASPAHTGKPPSPEIVAAIKEAINKGQQKYSIYNGESNQGPKHISFCLSPIQKLIEAEIGSEHE
jgi:hypothetical protein